MPSNLKHSNLLPQPGIISLGEGRFATKTSGVTKGHGLT